MADRRRGAEPPADKGETAVSVNAVGTSGVFANEKSMQQAYGLKYTPDRFSSYDTARSALPHYTKSHMIVRNDGGNDFRKGYYVVVPADASRLEKNGFKVMSAWE